MCFILCWFYVKENYFRMIATSNLRELNRYPVSLVFTKQTAKNMGELVKSNTKSNTTTKNQSLKGFKFK